MRSATQQYFWWESVCCGCSLESANVCWLFARINSRQTQKASAAESSDVNIFYLLLGLAYRIIAWCAKSQSFVSNLQLGGGRVEIKAVTCHYGRASNLLKRRRGWTEKWGRGGRKEWIVKAKQAKIVRQEQWLHVGYPATCLHSCFCIVPLLCFLITLKHLSIFYFQQSWEPSARVVSIQAAWCRKNLFQMFQHLR